MNESTQKKPLTALEWLRVTHAGTLSGRRIEEAIAAERAKVDGAIRALHSPVDRGTGPQCQGCATNVSFTPWPCKTIRALEAAEVRTA